MKKILITFVILIFILSVPIYLVYNGYMWHIFPNKNIYQISGLDISNHQGNIDFNVLSKEYRFIIIKATEGDDFVDKSFQKNLDGAKKYGYLTGAYHFFHFNYDGSKQAENFIKFAKKDFDIIPVVDVEFSGNPEKYDKNNVLNNIRKYILEIKKYYGKEPIIYVTQESYDQLIKGNFNNDIWMRSVIFNVDDNIDNLKIWQYNNRGRENGINNYVDKNVYKGNIDSFKELLM